MRELRVGRRMTLKFVADRAGVSEGFLSQVERGRTAPSLKTLQSVAHALGLEVGDLFVDPDLELPHFTPKAGRTVLEIGSLTKHRVTPSSVATLEINGGLFEVGGTAGESYSHGDSDEVFVVLTGEVRAEVDGKSFDMASGDSLIYRSSMQHTFHNIGDTESEVLWVVCPPSW
ncbi:MAG: helix-turn-helix transcriptional regulator [Actinobacteria bacterium]|nr:helix-turn-helix transcriptional regulator [Actinomycetota bacterium]